MKNIIYTKYSNERAERFKIRTDIVSDLEGRKIVKKTALTKEAYTHINNIYICYELLSQAYTDPKVSINKCCKTNDGLEFEYIKGSTLEEELDELLIKREYTQLIKKIRMYVSIVESGIGKKTFTPTEDFIKVFGNINLTIPLRAGEVNNIDFVFNNIIVGESWHIIDYEWTFNFLVPFNYIIYRAIHYYIYSSSKRSELISLGLYELFGITDEEIIQYASMEKNFQAYILGGLIPLRNIYGTTTEKNVNLQQVIEHKRINDFKNSIQVFYDYGQGFNEKQSDRFNLSLNAEGKISFEIPISSNVRQIRVDPTNDSSIVIIDNIIGYTKECYSIIYSTNGTILRDKTILFTTDDPQIIISNIKAGTTKIELKLEPQIISKKVIMDLSKLIEDKDKSMQDKEKSIQDKDKLIQDKDNSIQYKEKSIQDKMNQIIEKENYIQKLTNELDNYKLHCNSIISQKEELIKELDYYKLHYYTSIAQREELTRELEHYKLNYNSAITQRTDLTIRLEYIENAYNIMSNSTSWKITKPIRVSLDYTKKLLKSNRYTYIICKGLKCLKQNGGKYTLEKVKQKLKNDKSYNDYAKQNILTDEEEQLQINTKFSKDIKFSIVVPLYNTPEIFLCEMINSCIDQTYGNWELCLADGSSKEYRYVKKIVADYMKKDKRIKYKILEKNAGISENTNECIKMATGDYIALFDHDDMLHPSALFEYMKTICEKNADFIYCDEDKFETDVNVCFDPYFKPDFAIDNLRANNYICHFTVFKKSLLNDVGLFRKEFDGSQDHDMVLRLTEKAERIVHVPKVLYHWRVSSNSVASDPYAKPYTIQAGIDAVKEHLERCNLKSIVESSVIHPNIYRVKYDIIGDPLISILIPNKDHIEDLSRCINSILEKSTYKNIEIVIIENNSAEQETFEYYKTLGKYTNIKIVFYESKGKFNYSAINNCGVTYANGEHLLFLNNDIEIINENWLEEMLMYSQREDVGAVGAKLYYPNNTIQHAGLGIGILTLAGHYFRNFDRNATGYMGNLFYARNVSGVTAACVMMKKTIFSEIDGFDETFEVAFNDVDLCMRIRKSGYLIVWTPYAEAYHYESISRGAEDTPEKQERFKGEVTRFQMRWRKELDEGDPYYNANLTLDREDFSLRQGESI